MTPDAIAVPEGLLSSAEVAALERELAQSKTAAHTAAYLFLVMAASALFALLARQWYREYLDNQVEWRGFKESDDFGSFTNYKNMDSFDDHNPLTEISIATKRPGGAHLDYVAMVETRGPRTRR